MDEKLIAEQDLIAFESEIADLFDQGKIPYLTHFSGGNEDKLIEIFRQIKKGDYVFSTHRSHYHYLLSGGSPKELRKKILNGKSMFVFDRKLNFFSSSIVAGTPAIAAGVALAIKKKGSQNKVWCFVGDGSEDEGHFYEAVRYVDGWNLPCTFVIEDNDRSVDTPKKERYGNSKMVWPKCVLRYEYKPTYPHTGTGKWTEITAIPETCDEGKSEQSVTSLNSAPLNLSYKDALKQSMEMIAKKDNVLFLGYNVFHSSANGTLKDIPLEKRIELPVAENLMTGLAIGLSLEGYLPVLYFERHDFMLIALDAIANHLDKLKRISYGEYEAPVIIRAVVGSKKPLYPGLTHIQDFTSFFKNLLSFPIYDPKTSGEVLDAYQKAINSTSPIMIVERKELYDKIN